MDDKHVNQELSSTDRLPDPKLPRENPSKSGLLYVAVVAIAAAVTFAVLTYGLDR